MESLLFHPKLVHLPIALAILLPLVAGGLALAWWRGWFPRRTWIVAIALQALLVGSGVLAMETGEDQEERVEAVVPESAIEAHEEAAETFVWAAAAVLVLVVAAGVVPKAPIALVLAGVSVLGTLVVFGLGYQVGDAGGHLVYEHNAGSVYQNGGGYGGEGSGQEREHEHEDDD